MKFSKSFIGLLVAGCVVVVVGSLGWWWFNKGYIKIDPLSSYNDNGCRPGILVMPIPRDDPSHIIDALKQRGARIIEQRLPYPDQTQASITAEIVLGHRIEGDQLHQFETSLRNSNLRIGTNYYTNDQVLWQLRFNADQEDSVKQILNTFVPGYTVKKWNVDAPKKSDFIIISIFVKPNTEDEWIEYAKQQFGIEPNRDCILY